MVYHKTPTVVHCPHLFAGIDRVPMPGCHHYYLPPALSHCLVGAASEAASTAAAGMAMAVGV